MATRTSKFYDIFVISAVIILVVITVGIGMTVSTTPTTTPTPSPTPPTPTPTPTPAPPPSGEKGWHLIITLTGDESITTNPFNVPGETFRVIWNVTAIPGKEKAAFFSFHVYPTELSATKEIVPVYYTTHIEPYPYSDIKTLNGPGDFYFGISSSNVNWVVEVESYY